MTNRAGSRYQSMEITSMSGPRLVVFVYHHILGSLRAGHRAIGLKDHEGRCKALCRARDLVYELVGSLDREAGGELAANLFSLYEYFIHEITQIDLSNDAARLARLIELVVPLHEAWEGAARQLAEPTVPAGAGE
jgi:flagellar protein FliS